MSKKMTKPEAEGLVELVRRASQYFRHPDVETVLGYQTSNLTIINLQEISDYLTDHVLSKDAEGLTKRDRLMIARSLLKSADLLAYPTVSKISFALPSTAMASRLREAATQIKR
jgi:hypothetical protein